MRRKQYSMKWKVIGILLVCWLIPFLFLIGVLGVYIGSNHMDMTAMNYHSQLEFNNKICVERLNQAVADSRQVSYEGEILKIRGQYRQGLISYTEAQKSYNDYLNLKYQKSSTVSSAVLWFENDGLLQSSSAYSERGNGTYQQIRRYWEKDHEAVAAFAKTLDTSVGFLIREGSLYLVRNLVDSHYEPQGVLVFCINQDYCFNSVTQYPMQESLCIWLNDEMLLPYEAEIREEWEDRSEKIENKDYRWLHGQLCVADTISGDSYHIRTEMLLQKNITMYPFYGYPYVMGGMLLSLILMLAAVLGVFRREVTLPVKALSEGVRRIEQGELGYQIKEEMYNSEFLYLENAINHMSEHLEQQILKSYQEQIALREARIMALQSHINPHFLNNTLETINWEARLEGNEKVSKMIEALSNVMDAAMDRRKRPEVRLAEEMGYMNSYLYIMKERLGKRLTVQIDIPEGLMDCLVPRLVMQPVIENAIEHGVIPNGSGTVLIRGYHDEQYLYLEIQNDGGLTAGDRSRIDRLLDMEYNTSKEPAGNMGIANVNQRLRILFGEPCGLTIKEENRKVTALLTIPWRHMLAD
ncbi:MAG: sensor histidine kinase [Lachnospiraceae bacterium]|nr:sensor histidine kinase [Lachnospiraceae bacterium]